MITENHKNSQDCNLLTEQQQKAINLLLLGKTEKFIAEELEIARETVNRWRNHNHNFIAQLREQQRMVTRSNNLVPWALDVIEQALAKSDSQVAIAIIQALVPQQLVAEEVAPHLVLLAQARESIEQEEEAIASKEDSATKVSDLTNRRLQSIEGIASRSSFSRESNREGAYIDSYHLPGALRQSRGRKKNRKHSETMN